MVEVSLDVLTGRSAEFFTKLGSDGIFTIILFLVLFLVALTLIILWRTREKINWKFVLIYGLIYFQLLFLDIGASTPYVLCKCDGAFETYTLLRVLMHYVGWPAFGIIILANLIAGLSFFVIVNVISNIPKNKYRRGFVMALFNVIIWFYWYAHIFSAIHNYNLC